MLPVSLSSLTVPVEGIEAMQGGSQAWSTASLEGLLPLLWDLSPWFAGLMVLRCVPHALRSRTAWQAGRRA